MTGKFCQQLVLNLFFLQILTFGASACSGKETNSRKELSGFGQPIQVMFVRHGQTHANKYGITQGLLNSLLTEKGKLQAQKLGQHISNETFTRVYTSNLTRTRQTADIILKNLENASSCGPIIEDLRVREKGLGVLEGMKRTVHKISSPNIKNLARSSAETKKNLQKRVRSFFDEICGLADVEDKSSQRENILVVTHGIWLGQLIKYVKSDKFKLVNFRNPKGYSRNTGVTRMEVYPVSKKLPHHSRIIDFLSIYDVSHL